MAGMTVAAVLNFVPNNLWNLVRTWVKKDEVLMVYDVAFHVSTKRSFQLFICLMCASLFNQFARSVDIDCEFSGGGKVQDFINEKDANHRLNSFCWNYQVFLVAKGLKPEMKGEITYPGVTGFNRQKDEVIIHKYYNLVWAIFLKLGCLSMIPYLLWKNKGVKKIKDIIAINHAVVRPNCSVHQMRAIAFTHTIGFNKSDSHFYFLCKWLTLLTTIFGWMWVCVDLGYEFNLYGLDVVSIAFKSDNDNWPTITDKMFPIVAKCELSKYGYGGDVQLHSVICQLPMNKINQHLFFILYWYWVLIAIMNTMSLLWLLLHWTCPSIINTSFKRLLTDAFSIHPNQVRVKLDFGDWLVLSLIQRNLTDQEYREFLSNLQNIPNAVIEMYDTPTLIIEKGSRKRLPIFNFAKSNKGNCIGVGLDENRHNNMGFVLPQESINQTDNRISGHEIMG